METLVVNLFGAPGSGKSSLAYGIMWWLKVHDIKCEFVQEYAKGKFYEESHKTLDVQEYVFGKQLLHTTRCIGKVDVIITDAPLLHSIIYDAGKDPDFKKLVKKKHDSFNTLNVFLLRNHPYDQSGRYQNEDGAEKIGTEIRQLLNDLEVEVCEIKSGKDAPEKLFYIIHRKLYSNVNNL